MYRQTTLRLPCVSCGVEQALARMELAPRGGHWCWRCQMTAQIAEHESARPRGPMVGAALGGVLIAGSIAAVCISVLYVALIAIVAIVGWGTC